MFSSIPNEFEPIRKDLWSIEFPPEMNIPEQFQVSAARPRVNNNRVEVPYKNLTYYYKGKTTVDTITIVFRDVIGPHVYQKLFQWQREHTDFTAGTAGYASTYKKTLTLNMEDPTGAPVQKYRLLGCFIVNLDGQDLDMTDDGIATVSMEISFDEFQVEF